MKKVRIIARLDIKGPNVIKGIQFECLRVMGKPMEMAENYYLQGADEIIYLDTVANLYQRQKLLRIVSQSSEKIYIPFTIGGGIRSIDDIKELLKTGADKVAINTEATKNPELIRDAAKIFGSQCIVASIEAKKIGNDKWEAYVDNGRQPTGLDAVEWAKRTENLGAGEIFLTSVDMDGTENGLDLELIKRISEVLSIPLVVSGGVKNIDDFEECFRKYNVDGIAAASIFHYKKYNINEVKEELFGRGLNIRRTSSSGMVDTFPEQKYDLINYNKFTLRQLEDEVLKNIAVIQDDNVICDDQEEFDIGVIDYGINNLKSVIKAFEKIGRKAKWIDNSEDVNNARCLVLPGVGAFENGINGLRNKGLIESIKRRVNDGVPLLGICLGMQLLFDESEEYGIHKGLGLIPGKVVPLKSTADVRKKGYKVPHIGWNELRIPSHRKDRGWNDCVLETSQSNNAVYFVHTYFAKPDSIENIIATTVYGDQEFCAVVQRENITAMQFHPEKSGEVGLEMLRHFLEMNNL